MNQKKTWYQTNKKLWNQKTEIHLKSKFYDMEGFMDGKSTLQPIELGLLGDVAGKKILHLQCHFGQDTLSLARMGAKATGLDLSDKAIEVAQDLAQQLRLDARFICGNVLQADQLLQEQFDIVFTSYGTIGWLPELTSWGRVIRHFLKPDGRFVFVEFHPMTWLFDEQYEKIIYPYFNTHTFYEEYSTTYTDGPAHTPVMGYEWNHSLSEIFSALIDNGLMITHFKEYDYSPYDCYPNMVRSAYGYQITGLEGKIPMVYSMIATCK